MEIAGLSLKELKKVNEILISHKIKFDIDDDSSVIASNRNSLHNNIRHLNPGTISTSSKLVRIKSGLTKQVIDELEAIGIHISFDEFEPSYFEIPADEIMITKKKKFNQKVQIYLLFGAAVIMIAYLYLSSKS